MYIHKYEYIYYTYMLFYGTGLTQRTTHIRSQMFPLFDGQHRQTQTRPLPVGGGYIS